MSIVFCLSYHFGFFHITQLRSSDFFFRATDLDGGGEADDRIAIIGIDDKSLDRLGQLSSWPRTHYAHLVDTLRQAQARVIVFDILFHDPARDDDELLKSIRNSGNVILPVLYEPSSDRPSMAVQTNQNYNFIRPRDIFEQEAIALGHANVNPDADGVVRSLSIVIPSADGYQPSLALASVAAYLRRPEVLESPPGDGRLLFAGRNIPIDTCNEMLINFAGSPGVPGEMVGFQTVSFVDVLDGDVDPALFRDKIVIIGATASGLADYFWTPLAREMNGVEIHAIAIHTILEDSFLQRAPEALTMASIILLALLCGLIVASLRVLWAVVAVALLCLAYFLAAFSSFDSGVMLNMFYPPIAVAGTFVGVNVCNVVLEQSGRREITRIFGHYVSPPVLDRILEAQEEHRMELGGEECEVTTLFADVRNFTGISERIEPHELVRALNLYFSTIIKSVIDFNGIINKFGGDSVMAIWNVPVASEEHALLATKAAVSAQQAIKERQEQAPGLVKMEFGIGINTGRAIAGNMGSRDRVEYSVIGNTVNLASRIAGAAPGGRVWIGDGTFEQVKDSIKAAALSPLTIKGKQEPVKVYEVEDLVN